MKKIFLILLSITLFNQQAFAVTLSEALLEAFNNNTELNAERQNISVSQEDLKISKSEYLPSVTISGSKSKEDTDKLTNRSGANVSVKDADPLTQTLTIEQTLLDLEKNANIQKNKIGIDLAKVKLLKKEQEILLKAIEAYSGLILANQKFKINENNLGLLDRQVETDRARLERGQITLADLAQSEASLAGAQTKFIQSKNEITTSKLNYENIIGSISDPNSLEKNFDINFASPQTLSKAIEISKKNNPDLIIAKLEYEQSDKDVAIARTSLLPSARLSYENSRSKDFSSTYDEHNKSTLKATVSWTIYSGGKNRAALSKNRNLKNRKKLLLDNVIKTNDTKVASAWSSLQASKSLLNSVKLQVKAAEIANEGIAAEYESGLGRSTLDVIQSNSILLSSKVSFAEAERNYLLSQFKLLQSVGLLNNNYLKLQ
jgi:outer membrane protein